MTDRSSPSVPAADSGSVHEMSAGAAPGPLEGPGLYRLLVEGVLDYAIFALDATGRIVSWNAGAQRIKGYTREEILGQHFSIFYSPEEQASGKPAHMLEVAAATGSSGEEGWRVRKDGTRFWANVLITALRVNGEVVGFAKVTRDLTERRMAEEALRVSEERFGMLVEAVRDYGVFMLDPDGCVASWNVGAQRIVGYSADEVIGRHFSLFYPPADVESDKPRQELVVAVSEGRFEEEGWRVRKDGSLFWSSVVITPIRDADGRLVGFAKVTRDLTERRAAQERALADALRLAQAEAASDAKSQFLAVMSHELRTPLNAIGGYAELLALGVRGPVTETQRSDLERIRQSQQHLLGIINDVLNFTRVEAGQVQYDIQTVPAREMMDAVAALIAPLAARKNVVFDVRPAPPSLLARADRPKVEQILLNLLSNAVKFTPTGGRVSLEAAREGDAVLLSVRDNGPGIARGDRDAIFEPFVQLGRTLTTSHEGTGLGLAISRDLARAMGGEIGVESVQGEGATFTLRLPVA